MVGVPAEISFERDGAGKVTALVLHQNDLEQRGLRGEIPPPPQKVSLPIETLREYVGRYPVTPTFVLTITEEGGNLFAQASGQPKVQVFASAKDEFSYRIVNAQISFQRDGSSQVSGLVLHQNAGNVPAAKTAAIRFPGCPSASGAGCTALQSRSGRAAASSGRPAVIIKNMHSGRRPGADGPPDSDRNSSI